MTDERHEPELTETQKVYNVAEAELFELAAYGHHTHDPAYRNNGTHRTPQEREAGGEDYRNRLRQAQTRFEAAALVKAAAYFQSVLDDVQKPEQNAYYWSGVQHTIQGLQAQAADLLKEQQ